MKATYFKVDGSVSEVDIEPELEVLQSYVGGLIEPIFLPDKQVMIVNEEGLVIRLPLNTKATEYLLTVHPAFNEYFIVGDVLVGSIDLLGPE